MDHCRQQGTQARNTTRNKVHENGSLHVARYASKEHCQYQGTEAQSQMSIFFFLLLSYIFITFPAIFNILLIDYQWENVPRLWQSNLSQLILAILLKQKTVLLDPKTSILHLDIQNELYKNKDLITT